MSIAVTFRRKNLKHLDADKRQFADISKSVIFDRHNLMTSRV